MGRRPHCTGTSVPREPGAAAATADCLTLLGPGTPAPVDQYYNAGASDSFVALRDIKTICAREHCRGGSEESWRYHLREMSLPPQFDEPAFRGLRRLDEALDRGQARVFRVLWFVVPSGSVAWNLQFQALLVSRFFTDLALQALLYAALIASARSGGGAGDAALLGTAYLLPGVVLGLYGGAVADAVPKRVALAGAYLTMGALCLLIPLFFGTGFGSLLLVLFAVRVLHQVSQPSEASALPLVANEEELASATSFLSFSASTGDMIGKGLVAPLLVRAFGVTPVVVVAGLLFWLSASRVFDFRPRRRVVEAAPTTDGGVAVVSTRDVIRWLFTERGVLWMMLLVALASTINVVLGMLAPKYVQEVLGVDPANALWVFAPAAGGVVVALVAAPILIRVTGERFLAAVGFAMVAAIMMLLGLVGPLADTFGWVLVVDIPGVGEKVEMAATLSLFLGFGMTIAYAASHTFLSRTVPLGVQGRAFAVVGVLRDGLAIPPLLVMGVLAGVFGVEAVLVAAPVLLLAVGLGIDHLAGRWREPQPENRLIGGG